MHLVGYFHMIYNMMHGSTIINVAWNKVAKKTIPCYDFVILAIKFRFTHKREFLFYHLNNYSLS